MGRPPSWVTQAGSPADRSAKDRVNKLSLDERMAISEERWNLNEQEMRQAIADQRANGRTVTETITEPSGRITPRSLIRRERPALLRALSAHHDRRARQLNNQIGPDAGVQAVKSMSCATSCNRVISRASSRRAVESAGFGRVARKQPVSQSVRICPAVPKGVPKRTTSGRLLSLWEPVPAATLPVDGIANDRLAAGLALALMVS